MTEAPALTIEASVAGVIRLMADFSATGNLQTVAAVRSIVRDIIATDVEIGMHLWELTIYLQRALADRGDAE